MTEQSLFIVKPDAVARNLTGEVIARFERKGFKLVNLKLFTFTKEQAENFYGVHKDKPF
ncbi:MAG: nucleoside-diphosphate kinase, partial [Candidatus Nitrosomaritimum yanchengensis]